MSYNVIFYDLIPMYDNNNVHCFTFEWKKYEPNKDLMVGNWFKKWYGFYYRIL